MVRGTAAELHARPIEPGSRVEVLQIERSAVVLGSTQSMDVVDHERAARRGFDVVRRRSGGGVVVLQRDDHAWIDVTVPRGHSLWHDDVERATWWLGEAWCEALKETHPGGVWSVHREKLVATAPQRVVCFASIGPGEVARMDDDGRARKVVGISQRRTKDAARFQCTVFRVVDVALYADVLRATPPESLSNAVGVGDDLTNLAMRAAARFAAALG